MEVRKHGEKEPHPYKHELMQELKIILLTGLVGLIFFGIVILVYLFIHNYI